MPTSVRIAIIGAGSAQFSAGIVRDLYVTPGLSGSHVALMDVDEMRLGNVLTLAQRLAKEIKTDLTFSKTADQAAALKGADFVINTAQVGGHSWVEAQRALDEKHGYYRGAGLHCLGQMDFMVEVAQHAQALCPNAWLIQVSNPVFEGTTLIHRTTDMKVLGLCHGHYGYREIARMLGLDLKDVTALMPGFNHWIFMTDFRYKGKNAYPLLDEWIEKESEKFWAGTYYAGHDTQLSQAAVHQYKMFGCMPIGDAPRFTGWWYHTDLGTKQRWYGERGGFDSEIGWGQYLEGMQREVERIDRVVADMDTPVMNTFKPEQSDEQIVPIIDSLVNDIQRTFQVNIPNRGPIIRGFPEDLVIECQGVVNGSGIHGVHVPDLPKKLVVEIMNHRWCRAEMLVEAVRSKDRNVLLSYILDDQRTRSLEMAEKLIDEWLAEPRNRLRGSFK
jgi:alpha-galactosidase